MSDNPVLETEKFYPDESELKPTEAPVTEAEEPAGEDPEKLERQEPEQKAESEESLSTDEEKELYIDLDGDEVALADVKKWRDGHLMQSDYTKKTTALAEERKTFEAESTSQREQLAKDKAKVAEMADKLSVLVAEDESIDWADLKENDPDQYIKLKETADNRREALNKLQSERQTDDPAAIADEQGKLFAANPEWLGKDGEKTEVFHQDIKLMNEYAVSAGFSGEEFSQLTKAHYLTTILKAAKYDQLQEKSREIKGKRENVPVVLKPKSKETKTQPKSNAEVFYG